MNTLLPKSENEFAEVDYWERFFQSRAQAFDWYGEYISMIDLFTKYVKLQDDILIVGCGNSTLSYDLHVTQKCSKVCSIDISNNAINQMLKKHANSICKIINKNNKAFDFKCLDVCKFSEDSDIKKLLPLSCVIDKGTTDAIHSGGSDKIIRDMWMEIEKNLAVMGRYVLITLAQSHIVDSIVDFFIKQENNQWMINVHEMSSINSEDKSFVLPVLAFVFYKMKPSPSLPLVYIEENSFPNSKCQMKSEKKLLKNPLTELKEWVLSRQRLAILTNSIQESSQQESAIDMVSSKSGLVRYHCVLVRNNASKKSTNQMKYCVFIVPFGFNDSNFINDTDARLEMCKTHLKSRVCLFVYLNPREYYTNRQAIQDELNTIAVKFCPVDILDNYSIPFVSCNEFVYDSTTVLFDGYLFESLVTPCETYTRLIATSGKVSVVVSNKSISLRDRLLEKFIKSLSTIVAGTRGLYCGSIASTETLDGKWKIFVPGVDTKIVHFIKEKWHVEIVDSIGSGEKIEWLVCDLNVVDKELVEKSLQHLSDEGIAIFSCDNGLDVETVTKDLAIPTVYSCETVEIFGGDKTRFFVLCNKQIDVSLLEKNFKELCH